jgi:hypothetical protein
VKAKIIVKKLKVFVRELFNILTNCAVPILAALCALFEILQLPASAILALKKAERWCFFACGTRTEVEAIVGIVAGIVDEATEETEQTEKEQ